MGEKYDTLEVGSFGSGTFLASSFSDHLGGEYTAQTGFGWSNGVVIDTLARIPTLDCESGL